MVAIYFDPNESILLRTVTDFLQLLCMCKYRKFVKIQKLDT